MNIDYSDLFDDYLDTLVSEKVAMYMSYHYLNRAYSNVYDLNKLQENLFYVTAFLRQIISSNTKMTLYGETVNFDYIKKKYEKIVNKYNIIDDFICDRSLFIGKNIDDNKRVIDSLINMKRVLVDDSFVKWYYKYF